MKRFIIGLLIGIFTLGATAQFYRFNRFTTNADNLLINGNTITNVTGASQTPWAQDINGAGFALTNVSKLSTTGSGSIVSSDGFLTYTNGGLVLSNANNLTVQLTNGGGIFASNVVVSGTNDLKGKVLIKAAGTSSTVVNLGLDANNNVVTNAVPVGGGSGTQTPWAQDIQGAGFSLLDARAVVLGRSGNLGSTNGTIGITNANLLITPNGVGITMGDLSSTTASQSVLQMNGRTNRWGKLRANLLDELDSGLTVQGTNVNSTSVDKNILTMGGKRITGEIPSTWTNTANIHTNLAEFLGTNGGFAKFQEDASLVINTAANIRTNIGLIDIDTNNLVLATRYTNGIRRIFVSGSVQLTAAAAGTAKATLYAEYAGVLTNKVSATAGPLASLVETEQLQLFMGPSAIYYIADETSGTGASVSVVTGTCSVTGL